MCWFDSSPGHEPHQADEVLILFIVTVYVIESLSDQTWYTGMTLNEDNRLKEHNAGKNRFTKGHRPWKIIYSEKHQDWKVARVREKYLKSSGGKKWLTNFLKSII